ncbi:MAG: hypothetical protein IRY98_10590 [Alicyclobacillaceae bacterium]|nr:hypothetical protein [Alicyclobacillaceae bacterium]
MNEKELRQWLTYLTSELRRIETAVGTLSMIEQEHARKLTDFDHRKLRDLAVEEQNAARRLAAIKQMCLAMCQRIEEIQAGVRSEGVREEGREEGAPVH